MDVGANIGFYSLNASRIIGNSGRVYSFEPSVREYIRLLNNIRINDVKNIIPYNFALCDKQGEFVLSTAKTHTGLNTLNDKNEFDIQTHQLVQGITLDILLVKTKLNLT
ncbi:MAG: FkbM family methyltransferase [Ignavibacteriaceae bacterium]|nr:FkbM family methyltransferase [Ignavibacteriaceae bacterium]